LIHRKVAKGAKRFAKKCKKVLSFAPLRLCGENSKVEMEG
jgi:hypothetical protein